MNQGDIWTYNEELPPYTQTNRHRLAMTTTSLPSLYQQSRDEIESSIKEFSRMWPSRTEIVQPLGSSRFDDSRNCTIASNDLKTTDNATNYMKRNGAPMPVGGVPLPPLTLETEPNAWDLPTSMNEHQNQNRKFLGKYQTFVYFLCKFQNAFAVRKVECSIDYVDRC